MRTAARITIGQAVADLKAEFPDVDIKESKIRHLENEGLVEPERTPSGYRKYSVDDMEKLRYIIRAQREHYLPLKVIKEHLDALDRGLEPPPVSGSPSIPGALLANPAPGVESLLAGSSDVRISRRELVKTAEITEELLDAARELRPGPAPHRLQALRRRRPGDRQGRRRARGVRPRAPAPARLQDRRRPRGRPASSRCSRRSAAAARTAPRAAPPRRWTRWPSSRSASTPPW